MIIGISALIAISYTFYKSVSAFFIMLPLAFIYPIFYKKILIRKRKEKLLLEFKETISILSSLLGAGYSLENAVKECQEELKLLFDENSMIIKELSEINKKLSINIPIEKAFVDFASRSDIEEIENFSKIIFIAKKRGGDITKIIAKSIGIISDKIRVKEEIITLTTAKRLEQKLMSIFPILIIIYIDTGSGDFFKMMYTTIIGRIIMTVSLLIYFISNVLSIKILDIKV